MSNDPLIIFKNSAGISAFDLSVLIRTVLCALFLIWAAWIVYGQIKMIEKQDFNHLSNAILRILLLCSLMIILVFIQ
jgi:hypothetical protein